MQTYGYIRVSTKEQHTDRQEIALSGCNIPAQNLFIDKQSGKNFDRPAYKRLVRRIKPGDLLMVKSIDRLGRNYDEIIDQWRIITKEKGVNICVLDMPLLDTRTQNRDLTGTFIADLVLQILSYVAQTERDNIRQRQSEGIAAAKARGVKFGAKKKPVPEGFAVCRDMWRRGELSIRQAAEMLEISHMRFYRLCNEE